jgi:hypothetical protein
MNYQAFTNDSLTMMYEGIRGALASDDALRGLGEESRFRVRDTAEWKQHPQISRPKCSGAECLSKSSTGRKIKGSPPFERGGRPQRCWRRRFTPAGFFYNG